jgi:hypothetical protein
MEVCGQFDAPDRFILGDTFSVPIRYEAGWALEPVWTLRWKNIAPARNRILISQWFSL